MDALINFCFREKSYQGEVFVEDSEFPCLVFVILRQQELQKEFGEEITVKTDFETLLPKKDDYPALVELRKTVLATVKNTERFISAKKKWQDLKVA